MTEWTLVWLVPLRFFIIFGFSLLYTIGGRKHKWVRRILGSLFIGVSIIILSLIFHVFKWWILTLPFAYFGAMSLGYGGDTLREKFIRRSIYGLALGLCSLIPASLTQSWTLAGFQLAVCVLTNIYLGLINPTEAVNEEAIISGLSVISVPFMI